MGVYSYLDLGQLKPDGNNSGRWVPSWANGINNSNHITGNSTNGGTGASIHVNSPPGFYWASPGPMTTLAEDTITHFTWSFAIDDNDHMYGARESVIGNTENGGLHTAVYWASSSPSSITYLANLPGSGEKWAEALGTNGTIIVGHASENDLSISPRAVYWPTAASSPVSVGKPSGMGGSCSRLIGVKHVTIGSSSHDIAVGFASNSPYNNAATDSTYFAGGLGAYAYDITTSSYIVLPTPSGGYSTACAVAINTSGIIVGSAYQQAVDGQGHPLYNPDGSPVLIEYACKWTPNGLGSYPASGAVFLSTGGSFSSLLRATGINSSGTIVGIGWLSSVIRAFVM